MSTLLGILGVVLLGWGLYHLTPWGYLGHRVQASVAPSDDLSRLRERFATTDMSTEEFEEKARAILDPPPFWMPNSAKECVPEPVRPSPMQSWEVHVHDAPPGHHLHLHLGE